MFYDPLKCEVIGNIHEKKVEKTPYSYFWLDKFAKEFTTKYREELIELFKRKLEEKQNADTKPN